MFSQLLYLRLPSSRYWSRVELQSLLLHCLRFGIIDLNAICFNHHKSCIYSFQFRQQLLTCNGSCFWLFNYYKLESPRNCWNSWEVFRVSLSPINITKGKINLCPPSHLSPETSLCCGIIDGFSVDFMWPFPFPFPFTFLFPTPLLPPVPCPEDPEWQSVQRS